MSRAAVFARIVATPSRRLSCSARWASLLVRSALTRARSSRTSSATTWNLVRPDGPHRAALGTRLDLAHGAGEHRDDALVVEVAGTPLVARGGAGGAGLALASSSQELLLWGARDELAAADGQHPHALARPGRMGRRTQWARVGAPRRDSVPRICERSTRPAPTARPRCGTDGLQSMTAYRRADIVARGVAWPRAATTQIVAPVDPRGDFGAPAVSGRADGTRCATTGALREAPGTGDRGSDAASGTFGPRPATAPGGTLQGRKGMGTRDHPGPGPAGPVSAAQMALPSGKEVGPCRSPTSPRGTTSGTTTVRETGRRAGRGAGPAGSPPGGGPTGCPRSRHRHRSHLRPAHRAQRHGRARARLVALPRGRHAPGARGALVVRLRPARGAAASPTGADGRRPGRRRLSRDAGHRQLNGSSAPPQVTVEARHRRRDGPSPGRPAPALRPGAPTPSPARRTARSFGNSEVVHPVPPICAVTGIIPQP